MYKQQISEIITQNQNHMSLNYIIQYLQLTPLQQVPSPGIFNLDMSLVLISRFTDHYVVTRFCLFEESNNHYKVKLCVRAGLKTTS